MAAATNSHTSPPPSKSVRLLIHGERFDARRYSDPAQSEVLQQAMDAARHSYGYALCECRPNRLKLQVRLREGKYHLAVWPDQGHLHDSSCWFFREEDGNAPAEEINAQVQEREDGTRAIQLNFSLDRMTHAARPRYDTASRLSVDDHKQPEQSSLRGVLHLLWQEANLTRWHPNWEREWSRTRYELIQAAHHLTVKGVPLSQRLFIPRYYREEAKQQLNSEWEAFVAGLGKSSGGVIKSALLIAPVRKIVEIERGAAMHLRHLRHPVGINDITYSVIKSNCKQAMQRIQRNAEEYMRREESRASGWVQIRQPEVVAIAHVEASPRGGLWARGMWLLQVHPTLFIPASNADEVLLIDTLVRQGYQFSRSLTSAPPMQRDRHDWLVRHVLDPQGRPVPRAALEILNKGADPDYIAHRADLADAAAQRGVPVWTWTPTGSAVRRHIPPLPPHENTPPALIGQALQAIREDAAAFYAYGSGREPI